MIICDVSSCDDTLRQSFHFNFKGVRALTRTAEYAWGNVKRAEMEECNDGKKKRRKKIVYAAKCRGTIELLRYGCQRLRLGVFKLAEVSRVRLCLVWATDIQKFGCRRRLLGVEKVPKHRSSKFLEWARLWQRVCLHRLWWCWKSSLDTALSFPHELSYILTIPVAL